MRTVRAVEADVVHAVGDAVHKRVQPEVPVRPHGRLAERAPGAGRVNARHASARRTVDLFLGPKRPEEVEEVLGEAAGGGTAREIVQRIDVLDGVDAIAPALHLDEHGPLRPLAHPRAEKVLPRLVVRAQRAAVGKFPLAVRGIGLQQHVHELPERRGALYVVVLAFIHAPRLYAVAVRVVQLRDVVAVAERHFAECGLRLGRETPRRDVALRAIVQHGATEFADVPVERVAVVAYVGVLDVEAAVLNNLRVRERILVRLAVVEHAQGESDDGMRVGAREARVSVEHRRRDGTLPVRLASTTLPRRRETLGYPVRRGHLLMARRGNPHLPQGRPRRKNHFVATKHHALLTRLKRRAAPQAHHCRIVCEALRRVRGDERVVFHARVRHVRKAHAAVERVHHHVPREHEPVAGTRPSMVPKRNEVRPQPLARTKPAASHRHVPVRDGDFLRA